MRLALSQFLRYAVIGLISNLACYLLYLGLTVLGWGPKLAMSVIYGLAVVQTFLFNKRWTFGHQGRGRIVFIRYCLAYGAGYVINLAALALFVDSWRFPHQVVQAIMIPSLAVLLFLLQKFWVFHGAGTDTRFT